MTAKKMRNILFAGLALVAILIGALIYFATDFLRVAATETVQRQIYAEMSAEDVNQLQSLEVFLDNNQLVVKKAEQIVSDSKQYQYQDQIIKDLNRYAEQSGISINGYDFGVVTDKPKKSKTDKSKTKTISGVKSIPVAISLDSPMSYDNFLKFLKLLEQNVSKMQVAGISLTPDEENARLVKNPSVSLIVYVR